MYMCMHCVWIEPAELTVMCLLECHMSYCTCEIVYTLHHPLSDINNSMCESSLVA